MIIERVDEVRGKVKAPPSKSYTHRAYFLSLLADSPSKVMNPLISEDTIASLDAISKFGAQVNGNKIIPPQELTPGKIDARESGTTARISLAVASLARGTSVITGKGRLVERPFKPLVDALRSLKVKISGEKLPIAVEGGNPVGEYVKVDCSLSSQFGTAMLILASKIGLTVEMLNPVSRPYIEVTLKVMESFGIEFERNGFKVKVHPGIRGSKFHVPGDYSSASFFLAAGALYGKVKVSNLVKDDPQADARIIDILEEFGADVKVGRKYVVVERNEMKPINVDCSNFPDLFPILAVLASYAEGKSVITGRQLRLKESDRVKAVAVNLRKAGIKVKELPNGLEIVGGKPRGFTVESFNDHRIVMAMAILGLGAEGKTIIKDPHVVSKSYPSFFLDLRRVLNEG
ncbi:3-phosphoshikimate 1-carboxyvinyltransferase [Pyrococcus abyssi]|nr:3-phosphoshikimate 1-carboxyvinyltransferase [Pyrococcus abyssi]